MALLGMQGATKAERGRTLRIPDATDSSGPPGKCQSVAELSRSSGVIAEGYEPAAARTSKPTLPSSGPIGQHARRPRPLSIAGIDGWRPAAIW
jgi:hypothetical protein